MQNKKILLTGASGFIGHKTAEILLNQGHSVVGIDNENDYYDVRLKQYRYSQLKDHENYIYHKLDIEDYKGLEYIFRNYKFDVVINLSARTGG